MNPNIFVQFIQRIGLITLGLALASYTSDGIYYNGLETLVLTALMLGILNWLLKPILVLLTLPFVILSMGVGLWIINALLLELSAYLIPNFYVESFGSALWGAFLVSLVSMLFLKNHISSPKAQAPYEDTPAEGARTDKSLKHSKDIIDL